jgi:hypothetical protein
MTQGIEAANDAKTPIGGNSAVIVNSGAFAIISIMEKDQMPPR